MVGSGGGVVLGGLGGCERRIEVSGKIHKKKNWGGGGWVAGGGKGGQGGEGLGRGCGVSGWGGVRVDVNEELKFLGKFTKTKIGGGGSGGGVRWGVGLVGGGSGWM